MWVGADFVRRIRRGTPLEAETDEPAFGDAFEAGTGRGAARPLSLDLELVEPAPIETAELFPAVVPVEAPAPLPEAVPADVA